MITSPVKFFGAYVVNVNSQIAWGGDSSACSLTLVEDPDNGIKFTPPAIGTACLFQFDSFKFGGIFQRWTYKESVDQGRTYDVVLETPSKVLDGVYVILNGFQGTIYEDINVDTPYNGKQLTYGGSNPTNIINVFAYKENYKYGGLFGKADVNELGYPIKNIVGDIKATIDAGNFGGKIKYGSSEYSLNLDSLNDIIKNIQDYRLAGDYFDLNSLIKTIIDIGIGDYIVTLEGDAVNDLGVITKNPTIKIKTISRKEDPSPNIIQEKINYYKALPDKNKILSQYSIGKELSDSVTQKVLLGAPASRYWFADRRYIYPIWGKIGQGLNTQFFMGNSIYDYADPFTKIRITIDGGYEGNFTTVDTDILELRCARSGRETWSVYHMLTALKNGTTAIGIGKLNFTMDQYNKLLQGTLAPTDLMDTKIENAEIVASYLYGKWSDVQTVQLQRVAEARFNAVATAANEFYGKKYLVAMPLENGGKANNFRWVEQDVKEEYSWEIADSAWAGEKTKKQIPDVKFYEQTGKLQPVAVYDNFDNADYSDLGYEYSNISDPFNGVVTRASVNPDGFNMKFADDYSFVDISGKVYKDSAGKPIPPATSLKNQIVFCAMQIDNQITINDEITTQYNGFGVLAKLILGYGGMSYHNAFGFNGADIPIAPAPLVPQFIGVPQVSRRYVWGPWFSIGANNGKVSIITDATFAPETFGTVAEMDKQAKTYVNAEVAKVYESESGFVELAESPQFNLADRFLQTGPYITGLSLSISTGGIVSTYQFATWTKRGANLAKYNIDRIARSQGKNFEYTKRIRELYRNPLPKALLPIGLFEKSAKRNTTAIHGVFGNFMNAAARSINGYDINTGKFPGVNIQALPMEAIQEGVGLVYREAFGNTMDQLYSMGFLYNQRNPEQAVSDFNA